MFQGKAHWAPFRPMQSVASNLALISAPSRQTQPPLAAPSSPFDLASYKMDHLMLHSNQQLQLPLRLPLATQPQQPASHSTTLPAETPQDTSTTSQPVAITSGTAVSALLNSIYSRKVAPQAAPASDVTTTTSTNHLLTNAASVSSQTSSQEYLLDRKARKKDQNRRAALNYRRKKMEEKNRIREEEMRLVYSRVCQIGYAEQLDKLIMYILETKSMRIADKDSNQLLLLCPLCPLTCDSSLNLRSHLNMAYYRDINSLPC